MHKVTFLVAFLCAALLLSGTAIAGNQNLLPNGEPNLTIHPPMHKASHQLNRDEDGFMTYRFVVSEDGGESWSEIRGTGDTGMWLDGDPAWGDGGYNFGFYADADNMGHFIGILDEFTDEDNPEERVNGIYDIKTNIAADDVSYTMIAAEGETANFTWSDAGKDMDGNGIAMWESDVGDTREFWMATFDQGWGQPFMVAEGLDDDDHYPHMTDMNGDNVYIIYQIANADSGYWEHYVIKVNGGQPTQYGPITESGTFVSYYTSAVNPIAQDVDAGVVYFAVRNRALDGTAVGFSDDGGENWVVETVPGAQRYPSCAVGEDSPWVFSNIGIPAPDTNGVYPNHYNWIAYDGLGYGGGDWVGPDPVMEIAYPGEVYYTALGNFTPEGRLVMGSNVWSYPDPVLTPSAFMVAYSDDLGESWSDTMRIVDYIEDGLNAGYLPQIGMNNGTDNTIWVTFCCLYGVTDVYAPEPDDESVTLSSTTIGEPWNASCLVADENVGATGISYVDINWLNINAEGEEVGWEYVEADSADADEDGNGTYFFTMPSDTMHGQALAEGDTIYFFIFAQDGVGNSGEGGLQMIVVGEDFVAGIDNPTVELPTQIELGQNYPNPFNNSTVIPFTVNRTSKVTLSVYDISGRLVKTLHDGTIAAGHHEIAWSGEGATSGVYFYALNSGSERYIGKMTLIR